MTEISPPVCFSKLSSSWAPRLNRFLPPSATIPIPLLPRPLRSSSTSGSHPLGDDPLGSFPWSDGESGIEWVQEGRVTLFTADGLVQIGGSVFPRLLNSASQKRQGKSRVSQRFQRYQESDYMDPKQGLCLGALFDIAAMNGLDMGRRLCILGFCRSIEMLSDVVEDSVGAWRQGGCCGEGDQRWAS